MIENRDSLQNILSQEEIDALLSPEGSKPASESQTPLIRPQTRPTPLPQLEKYLDVFARHLMSSVRRLTEGEDISVELDTFISGQLGAYLDTISMPAMLAFFKSTKEQSSGLISIDPALAYTLIDMALGGRRGTAAMQIEDRKYTSIERQIIHRFAKGLLKDLSDAFQTSFIFDSLDTNPKTALIDSPVCEMMIARMKMTIDKRGGLFDIVLPAHALKKMALDECALEDNPLIYQWTEDLVHRFAQVPLEVSAVLDTQTVPLKTIMSWKEGDTLPLSFFHDKPIALSCMNVPLFHGKLDPAHQNATIVITKGSGDGA